MSSTEDNNRANENYARETSIPLRKLYFMLLDLYDGEYPIPFYEFRRVFDKYMRVTRNCLVDSLILLIYGAGKISKIATDEEEITSDRFQEVPENNSNKESSENMNEEKEIPVQTKEIVKHKSPVWRFIQDETEIRIGYDYAVKLNIPIGENPDEENKNTTDENKSDEINSLIGIDEKKFVIPDIEFYIDNHKNKLFWIMNHRECEIDLETYHLECRFYGKTIPIDEKFKEIEVQPVPEGAIAKKSYKSDKIIVTELENGDQFCCCPLGGYFDTIYSKSGLIVRTYAVLI